jgi:hypothetical protein
MEAMNQLQAKLHRAVFGPPHPVIVTEQRADPVELVFQAVLRLEPEQRTRLIQRLKSRWGSPPNLHDLKGPR